jgi:hypothetical protein
LFFLTRCALDAGAKNSFNFLLAEHSKHLPLDLAVAVKLEAMKEPESSDILKRQERWFRRHMESDKGLSGVIRGMFDVPLSRVLKGKAGSSKKT